MEGFLVVAAVQMFDHGTLDRPRASFHSSQGAKAGAVRGADVQFRDLLIYCATAVTYTTMWFAEGRDLLELRVSVY